ncbi:MAG: trypsin-like peptidase domain-containing protein [Bacilli bacterium]|nr:trypsin-like peptidase domain-containing protein [Bacilli bacterium]
MKKNNSLNLIICLFIAFIGGGLLMYYIFYNTDALDNSGTTVASGINTCKSCNGTVIVNDGSLSAAVDKIYDAVMMVRNYKGDQIQSTGSGFVYKTDDKYGYLLTNHHVVDGATKITLIRSDDQEIEGEVLGSDSYLDLAVVRIAKKDVLDVASIGTSENSKLGDTVFTVGSPLGYEYRGTVTDGILSGKDRMVTVSISGNSDDYVMKVLQTNAAVNPGNSGGPLLNAEGEVIGIISLKLVETQVENMGFAIPIEYAMSHIENLEKGNALVRPMLGISMINVNDTYSLYRSGIMLDKSITDGVVVVEVSKDSGASKSDLQKGDVIIKLNDEKIANYAYLRYELYKYNVGDTITVTYLRDGKEHTTKVTLTEYKED